MNEPATRPARGYALVGVLLALLLFAAGGFLWFSGRQGAAVGGTFTLVNGQGQVVTNQTFRGKYMLVYFGYTHCPDVCPTTLADVAAALGKLGPKAARVVPVFITVDPARDTPAVVGRYTALFSPRIVGLTGSAAQIAHVAGEYHVYYAKHVTGPGPDDYSMDHSSVLYLMGPNGQFVAPVAAESSVKAMTASLERLVS
ncbi:MAG: SCO family protein [Acetobacteraceae bacterium]